MSKTTAIVVIVVALIALGIFLWIVSMGVSNVQENQFCENWLANIEEQRAQMEDEWFPDTNLFNQEVADYNRQCAF